ncbi:MAG: 50S ribosomal protein L5 [Phycisphaerales bacterium]|nr:50S ribosomal protein L5 [Phycisphaerales bacterium]
MAKDTTKPKGSSKSKAHDGPIGPMPEPRLKQLFKEKVDAAVGQKFDLTNPMERPRLKSITINVNMGRHLEGTKLKPLVRETVLQTITKISGQKPIVIKAKKSVSNFKVRAGYETATMVTLRRDRMWYFLDRLIHLVTPRIRDFRGLNPKAFDRQGNYSMGLSEQGVFPEINMAEVNFTHGMNINFVFDKSDPEMSRFLLSELGFPFRKDEKEGKAAAGAA